MTSESVREEVEAIRARAEAAEAEVERLRKVLKALADFTDPEGVKPFHSPIGIARFVNERADAALTPYKFVQRATYPERTDERKRTEAPESTVLHE